MTLAAYTMRALPAQLSGLMPLALDLRWSWHHGSDRLWRLLDEDVWESTQNAWLVLNSVSSEHLLAQASEPVLVQESRRRPGCTPQSSR